MSRRPLFVPLISSLAAILILAAGCSDQAPTSAQLDSSYKAVALPEAGMAPSFSMQATARQVIGAEGGVIRAGRVTISFPAGAVASPTEITVAPNKKTLAVTFGPHGIRFPAGHEPTLTFNYQGITGLPEQDLMIHYVGNSGELIERLQASVDATSKSVSAQLSHFSEYVVLTP